jgi:hypothetical protein
MIVSSIEPIADGRDCARRKIQKTHAEFGLNKTQSRSHRVLHLAKLLKATLAGVVGAVQQAISYISLDANSAMYLKVPIDQERILFNTP